jgi:prepilin-type N-terminal cleavage/methylation domain-containing protein
MGTAKRQFRRRGFTLVEAMLVLVVMSIIALAAGVGLQSIARAPAGNDAQLAVDNYIIDKLEALRATDFASLTVGTATDTVTIRGTNYTRTTVIALADADGTGGTDTDFKQITVTLNGRSLSTFVCQP